MKDKNPHVISHGMSLLIKSVVYMCIVLMYYYLHAGIQIIPPLKEKKEFLPYAWLPVSKGPKSFKELHICDFRANYSHVRICAAKPDFDLGSVIATENILMDDPNMKMLLVINHNDDYTIPNLPDQKWAVPIAVVTAHSGVHLMQVLRKHPRDTKMSIFPGIPQEPHSKRKHINGPAHQGLLSLCNTSQTLLNSHIKCYYLLPACVTVLILDNQSLYVGLALTCPLVHVHTYESLLNLQMLVF